MGHKDSTSFLSTNDGTQGSKEYGIVLIEIAIGIPVFLILFFLLLWMSNVNNSRSALTHAIRVGVRGGGTRGNENLMNQKRWLISLSSLNDDEALLLPIDRYAVGNASFDTFKHLIVSKDLEDKFQNVSDLQLPTSKGVSFPKSCVTCLYALVYVYEYMKSAVGGDVRYPCDPADLDDSKRGDGCLQCSFTPVPVPTGVPSPLSDENFMISCRYSPAMTLHRIILNLASRIGSNVTAADLLMIERKGAYKKLRNE